MYNNLNLAYDEIYSKLYHIIYNNIFKNALKCFSLHIHIEVYCILKTFGDYIRNKDIVIVTYLCSIWGKTI